MIEKASEALDISSSEASTIVNNLITALENYRSERLESMKPKQPEKRTLSEAERKAAVTFLKSPNLMQRTKQVIADSGLIGEENNSLIAYLTYTSRKRHTPLHLMCLGASGTGKTWLQEKVSELMPEEDKLEITTLSSNAFSNLTEYQTATGNTRGSTGSGGIISFDPSTTTSSMNTAGNTNRPSYIGLGHEMAHGRDANFGVLHFSNDYTSGTGVTYQSQFMGLKKSEWRAAYYENLIRGQAGVPLRTHYGLSNDVNTSTSQGLGPKLLDVNNRPINYYK